MKKIDITSPKGKEIFYKIATIIVDSFENYDLISGCVNVRFEGNYELEDHAQEYVYYSCVEIAYIIIRSMHTTMNKTYSSKRKDMLRTVLYNVCRCMGYVYPDGDEAEFDFMAGEIYERIQNVDRKEVYLEDVKNIIDKLIGSAYPMSDSDYMDLLEDRQIEWLEE